jgi:hypothetical protein
VPDVLERISALGARIRAEMIAGSTLDDVLHALHREVYGAVELVAAVREVGGMQLTTAKVLVSNICDGRRYPHLTLADLELLGDTPRTGSVDYFTHRERDDAIVDRKPWLLYARKSKQSVYVLTSAIPLAAFPAPLREGEYGSRSGSSVSFESVAADARAAAAAWPTEIAIERDDPDELLLHFLRAPSR